MPTERTPLENEAVAFHYNFKRLNEAMDNYIAQMSLAGSAKSKIDAIEKNGGDARNWHQIAAGCDQKVNNNMKIATEAWQELKKMFAKVD